MVPELLILALDFYRAPLAYPQLASPDQPLPESFDNLIGAFAVALSPANIATTAQALGTSPAVVKQASSFFLRQVLLVPGGNHYRVLGLSPDASEEDIREHYHLLVRIFHPDRSDGDPERNAEYTARINDAYNTLKKTDTRERYDRQLGLVQRGQRRAGVEIERFHPGRPVASNPVRSRGAAPVGVGNRRTIWVLAGGVVLVALVLAFTLLTSARRPVLRTNPELANASIAEPSFLRERSLSEVGSSLAQQPASSREPIDKGSREEDDPKVPVLAVTKPVANFSATTEHGQPPGEGKTRDQIRNAAILGLAPYPNSQDGTDPHGSGSESTLVQPTTQGATVPSQVPSAMQVGQAGSPMSKESPSITARASSTAMDGSGNAKQKVAPAASDPPIPDAAAPPDLAQAKVEADQSDAKAKPGGATEAVSADTEVARRPDPSTPKKPQTVKDKKPKKAEDKKPQTAKDKKPKKAEEQEPIAKSAKKQKPVSNKPSSEAAARRQPPPEEMIARLMRYYRAGDLQRLLGLFTADASVTGGKGRSAIRSDYAGLFARTSDRRLSIRKLSWRRTGNGSFVGVGSYRAGTKANPGASWRYSTGTMRIKLVPQKGSYKIAELFH